MRSFLASSLRVASITQTDNKSLDALPLPPRIPYDVTLNGNTMRITAYRKGFLAGPNFVACLIQMLTTSFDATWRMSDQYTELEDNFFICQEGSLELKVGAINDAYRHMYYSDLITLGNMMGKFQKQYTTPSLEFDYLVGIHLIGNGRVGVDSGNAETA